MIDPLDLSYIRGTRDSLNLLLQADRGCVSGSTLLQQQIAREGFTFSDLLLLTVVNAMRATRIDDDIITTVCLRFGSDISSYGDEYELSPENSRLAMLLFASGSAAGWKYVRWQTPGVQETLDLQPYVEHRQQTTIGISYNVQLFAHLIAQHGVKLDDRHIRPEILPRK